MDNTADNDGPCRCFVEGDVLVKRDYVVEGSAAKEGDKVTADGKKDIDDVHMQDQSCRTSNRYGWKFRRKASSKTKRYTLKVTPKVARASTRLSFNW